MQADVAWQERSGFPIGPDSMPICKDTFIPGG